MGPADERLVADAGARPPSGPLADRDFRLVLGGQVVSAFGDAVTLTALPLLVLALTGSGALLGVVGALQLLPDLLIGLLAGALADRVDRRWLIVWCDAGRAVLTMLIPLAWWSGWPMMPVILAVVVPINLCRVMSDAGLTSAIPALVGRDQLGRANGLMEATLSVPYIVGPGLAGVLVATLGAAETIAVDAATFAVSALATACVRRTLRAERPAQLPRVRADIAEGIRFIWRHGVVRLAIAHWAALTVATASLVPALGYYITIDRHRGAELFGLVGSAWSVGYLGGSLFVMRLGPERVGRRMVAASATIGVALAAVVATALPVVYLVAAACVGAALAVEAVSYSTLRASNTPDELLGRVGSGARAMTAAVMPLGLLAGGGLVEATDGRVAIGAMAAACIVVAAAFASSPTFRAARYG